MSWQAETDPRSMSASAHSPAATWHTATVEQDHSQQIITVDFLSMMPLPSMCPSSQVARPAASLASTYLWGITVGVAIDAKGAQQHVLRLLISAHLHEQPVPPPQSQS